MQRHSQSHRAVAWVLALSGCDLASGSGASGASGAAISDSPASTAPQTHPIHDDAPPERIPPDDIDEVSPQRGRADDDQCVDTDGDGWQVCPDGGAGPFDCNDDDPDIFPGHGPGCDGRDHDCDGIPDTNQDHGCTAGRPDETETRRGGTAAAPAPPTRPWPDGCEDEDADGWPACANSAFPRIDCDDQDADVFPGHGPGCDGRDHDCDGTPDTEQVDGCTMGTSSGESEPR